MGTVEHRKRGDICAGSLLGAALLLISAAPAQAQQPFANWRLPPELGDARTAGLADPVTALADDSGLARLNPAALAFAPRTLDAAAGGRFGTSLFASHAAGAFHPRRSLGLGLTLRSRPVEETARALRALERGGSGSAFDERTRLSEIGLGAGWRVGDHLALGAALHASELSVRASRAGRVSAAGAAWRPRVVLGLAFEPGRRDAPRVNLALRLPTTWRLADAGGLELRSPFSLSTGASWDYHFGRARPSRLLLALQNDLLRRAAPASGPRPPGFVARLDADLRVGLELSLPLSSCTSGCGSLLQVRGGVARLTLAPTAADPRRTAERETTWHAGLSLAPGWRPLGYGRFKLDAGVRFARRGPAFLLGVSARVPEGYRSLASHE